MATVWQRFNALMLVLAFLALLTLIAMVAMRAEGGPLDPPGTPDPTDSVRLPGTPIDGPIVITSPGHYYLTRDISITGSATVITVASSAVSVDLGGFTIAGSGAAGSVGISITSGAERVSISNGSINSVDVGLVSEAQYAVIDRVHITLSGDAFRLGQDNTPTNCTASGNSEVGISLQGQRAVVRACFVVDNGEEGIALSSEHGLVEGSYATANNANINAVLANIRVTGSNNVIRENHIGTSAGALEVHVTGTGNVLTDNVCTDAVFAVVSGNLAAQADHLNVNCGSVTPP